MSNELPVKSEKDYRTYGLSRSGNKKFWLAEDRFNHAYYCILNVVLLFSYVVFSMQIFFCPDFVYNIETGGKLFFCT